MAPIRVGTNLLIHPINHRLNECQCGIDHTPFDPTFGTKNRLSDIA